MGTLEKEELETLKTQNLNLLNPSRARFPQLSAREVSQGPKLLLNDVILGAGTKYISGIKETIPALEKKASTHIDLEKKQIPQKCYPLAQHRATNTIKNGIAGGSIDISAVNSGMSLRLLKFSSLGNA